MNDALTTALDVVSLLLILSGAFFFTAGTIGLIRFGDVRSRLHALTKADNLGLGMILAGVALQLGSWTTAGLLLITWLLALAAASVSAHVIGGIETERELTGEDLGESAPDGAHGQPSDRSQETDRSPGRADGAPGAPSAGGEHS